MKKPKTRVLAIVLGLFVAPHVIYGVLCPVLSDIGFIPGLTLGPYVYAAPFLPLPVGWNDVAPWALPILLFCGTLAGAIFSAHRAGFTVTVVSLALDYLLVLMNSFWFLVLVVGGGVPST